MVKRFRQLQSRDSVDTRGATMLEYALLAALIAIVCLAGVSFLGKEANSTNCKVAAAMVAQCPAGQIFDCTLGVCS